MKKVLSIIFAAALALALAAPAAAGDEHPYVTDDARVLSQSTVEAVNEANTRLYDEYGTYLVVVLIDYFGETDPDEYIVGLFNSWGISDDAALLVASVKEKKGGITLGSAIESASNERDMGEMLDKYFWPDFDDGDYDRAVTKLMDAMEDWLTAQFGGQTSDSSGWLAGLGIIGVILGFIFRNIFIILIFVLIIVLIIGADRRRYRGYYTGVGLPVPRYYPWYIFVRSHPYHRYRPPTPPRQSGPAGFGGFSGPRPSGPRPSSPRRTSAPRPSAPRPSRPSAPRPPRPSGGTFRGGGGRSGGGFSGRR